MVEAQTTGTQGRETLQDQFGTVASMVITFDAPPLAEVSLGRAFILRPDFLVPHFGAFWSELRSEFPLVEHAMPIMSAGDGSEPLDQGPFWLPRVWMISKDSTRLVQLQQNRIHYNWRQTPASAEYIRFDAIKAATVRVWDQLDSFVRRELQQPLVPLGNELTYTNILEAANGESAFDVARRALRDVTWATGPRMLSSPGQISYMLGFPLPHGFGDLSVTVASGRRANGTPLIKLDLVAKGNDGGAGDFLRWAQVAHDFLVSAFRDLTTAEMHKSWRLREDASGQ